MRHALLLATALTVLGAGRPARAEAPFTLAGTPGQLPKTVVPSAYVIDIVADMDRLALSGHESIAVKATGAGDSITLNQAGLTLSRATVDGVPTTISQDDAAQTATLRLAHPLADGAHTLSIDYAGPIPATPNGIYHDDYRDRSGAAKRMLVTQFEVADARRMFPSWDEPAFKATFRLGVTLPRDFVPVGNMPVASSTPVGANAKQVVFETSPRMSTYLLALVAGDLSALHGSGGSTAIGAYAPTGTQAEGAYALAAATRILPYYNAYFGVRYPLPKLDLVAIPGNYEAGAMENWGDITFIDDALLFDPQTSAPRTRETIFVDVAHEMAHQWSGDLVTMGWWDNIWLNEGFATWMQNKATDHFNPSWQMWPRAHADREEAMGVDAQPTTHPIQQTVADVSAANAAFDLISYQKGEQVIRMVEDWLGPDTFRDGMRAYMKAHAYGNTTSADLWASLGGVSHKDVATVARSFTEQPGIPLLSVARRCDAGHSVLTLTQSRFTIHDANPKPLSWQIPVRVGGPGVAPQTILLRNEPATLRFAGCTAALKADLGEAGYYRTHYDAAGLAALKPAFSTLAAADRANLLGDQFALFEAGTAPLGDYLDLAATLSDGRERSLAVWEDTISHLKRLDALERGGASRPAFRAFARGLLQPQLARLGWTPRPGEDFPDTLLRPNLIAALGQFDDPAVAAEARRRFAAYLKDRSSLPPSLLDPVTRVVGQHADAATASILEQHLLAASDTEQKLRYFGALAASSDPVRIARNVRLSYSGVIPNGRIVLAIAMVAAESDNPGAAWAAVEENQATIRTHLTPMSQAALLPAVARASNDPSIAKAMLADPASAASSGARIEAARASDTIAAGITLRDRTQPAIASWLEHRVGNKS